MVNRLNVDIWSDIACPWCYIGKRRFERALSLFNTQFDAKPAVEVTWRAFELDPAAPPRRDTSESYVVRVARKYGNTVAQTQQRIDQIVQLAAAEGVAFDFEHIKPGNTFRAHRLLHLAHERGVQDALKERLLRGYLCQGVALADDEGLLRLAAEAGLELDEVRRVLATDDYASAVRADQREASELGIGGVPFFRIGRYGVSGAQPAELLLHALNDAWKELSPPLEWLDTAASACGPDGCS